MRPAEDLEPRGDSDEIGYGARLHLPHHLAAVRLHRDLADAELRAHLLVEHPRNYQAQHLALAPAERSVILPEHPQLHELAQGSAAAIDRLPDRAEQHVV